MLDHLRTQQHGLPMRIKGQPSRFRTSPPTPTWVLATYVLANLVALRKVACLTFVCLACNTCTMPPASAVAAACQHDSIPFDRNLSEHPPCRRQSAWPAAPLDPNPCAIPLRGLCSTAACGHVPPARSQRLLPSCADPPSKRAPRTADSHRGQREMAAGRRPLRLRISHHG